MTDPVGTPPTPIWNGTAWVLPEVAPVPVVTTSTPVTGAVDDPLLKTVGDVAAAVGTVKGEIGAVESESSVAGMALGAAEAAESVAPIAEGLLADLAELEASLVAKGSGIVALIKKAASAFHGISL